MTALVFSRVRTGGLRDLSATFETGVHGVLSDVQDGGTDLVSAAAGVLRPGKGRVLVDALDPHRSPEARRRIGSLLPEERFPGTALVRDAVELALAVRRDSTTAEAVLSGVDLQAWASRTTASLSSQEARTVALAIALSLPEPKVLALFEPLAAGLDSERIVSRLRERARGGAVVLCVTASARDAALLSARVRVLDAGRFAGELTPPGAAPPSHPILVGTGAPDALIEALGEETSVTRAVRDETGVVLVQGPDRNATALAILRAARKAQAKILWLTDRGSRPRVFVGAGAGRGAP